MEIYVKNFFDFHIFPFPRFNHHVIVYTDLMRIAASNTTTDDVTN